MDGAAEVPASLLKWATPDENAAEFFRRQGREAMATGLLFIDQHIKLRPGHILELAGPAGSAKTEMLIQVTAGHAWRPPSSSINTTIHVRVHTVHTVHTVAVAVWDIFADDSSHALQQYERA